MGVKRFGVAFVATASIVLAYALPARAQEAPPPASSTPAETTSTEAETPAPDATPSTPSSSEPAKPSTPAPDATPSADTAKADTPSAESTPAPDAKSAEPATTEPAKTEPAEAKPAEATPAPKDAVKLEPPTPTPAAPAPPAAAPAPQAAQAQAPSAASTQVTIVLVAETPAAADPAASATGTAAEAAETAAAMIVSFRPHRAPSAISLLPTVDRTVASASPAPRRAIPAKSSVRQTCARPTARVPLSADCEQARVISAFRVRLRYLPGSEVREAIVRGPSRISIRRVETRPQPESKAVKKHPVAEVRPTVPFGSSGQGAANHSFNRSTGATWSSRVLVLAAPPLRVPRPSRFVRLRLPSTIPHGVIAAPPPARPG